MITISKTIETFINDVNTENGHLIRLFEGILTFIFRGVIVLGVPLIVYILLF